MKEFLAGIFGGKSWTESLTAWGLVVYVVGEAIIEQVCSGGLMSAEICDVAKAWTTQIGVVLTDLGIRRAANS